MICGKCGVDKPRFKSETKLDYRLAHLYIDDQGGRWNGRTCPGCMKVLRRGWRKAKAAGAAPRYKKRGRPQTEKSGYDCRRCKKALPITRRFHHEECAPGKDSWDMFETYGVNLG